MGCPERHYREMLVSYIRMNVSFTKLSKKLTEENLFKLDTNDLEVLAKSLIVVILNMLLICVVVLLQML